MIGWSPAELWAATMFEFSAAVVAHARLNVPKKEGAPKPGGPSLRDFFKAKAAETAARGRNG